MLSTTVLFVATILVAVVAAGVLLPLVDSTFRALGVLTLVVVCEIGVVFLFLRAILRRTVLRPVDRIVEHAEGIASGDLSHRIPRQDLRELDRIVDSINTLADHLIDEKEALADNVASLEITNQQLSETTRELVRAARLASVGTLAGGVAHEIGNPLAAVRGYLDIVEGRTKQGRDVSDILEDARGEVERIDAIIRHILAFGRSGEAAGQQPVTDAARVLSGVVHETRTRLGIPERTLVFEAESDLPPVRAHPRVLERIATNLIENAVLSTREAEDPTVTLGVRAGSTDDYEMSVPRRRTDDPPQVDYMHRRRLSQLLEVRAPPPADAGRRTLVIEVTDRGPGIPEEALPQIFDPFFTTRGVGEGTGMGLALVARMVGELGGDVEVENRAGGGARFEVHLPGIEVDTP